METPNKSKHDLSFYQYPTHFNMNPVVYFCLFSILFCFVLFCFVLFDFVWFVTRAVVLMLTRLLFSGWQWKRVRGRGGVWLWGFREWRRQGEEASQWAGWSGRGAGVGQVSSRILPFLPQIYWGKFSIKYCGKAAVSFYVISESVKWGRNMYLLVLQSEMRTFLIILFSRFQKGMNRREKALSGKSRVSHSVHCPYYTDDKQEFW